MTSIIPAMQMFGDALQWLGVILSPLLIIPMALSFLPAKLRSTALSVAGAIDVVSRGLLTLAGWLALIMATAMLATVIMRYVYGVSFGWARDLWIYAFAGCFMLASAGALRTAAHVRVDIWFSQMSLRQRAMVDIAGTYLALFPLMILILNAYAPQLANAWGAASGRLELSRETDGLPLTYLFKTLVPVFAVTMLVQGWANAVRAAAILSGLSVAAPALTNEVEQR